MRVSDSSVGGGAGQFHTTRWTLAMAFARSQIQTGRAVLALPVRPIGTNCARRSAAPFQTPPLWTLKFTGFAKLWSRPKGGSCRESDIQRSRRGKSGRVSPRRNPNLPGLRHEVFDHWR